MHAVSLIGTIIRNRLLGCAFLASISGFQLDGSGCRKLIGEGNYGS